MTDDPRFCKMTVTVSREGIVTQVVAEEQNGTGAPSVSSRLQWQHLRATSSGETSDVTPSLKTTAAPGTMPIVLSLEPPAKSAK